MRKTMGVVGVVVVVACFARVVTALPTADEVFEKMVKKAEDIKTVACDMKMSGKPQGQQEMKGQGRRTAEFLKKEDGSIVRKMRMEMKLRVSMQGQEMEMETKAVSDGEWVWVENKSPMMPQVMVMKG